MPRALLILPTAGYRTEDFLAAAAALDVDVVVATDDGGVVAAALAATRLGLPSNPPDAAGRARNKLALREALAAAGVAQPRFAELPPGGDVAAVGFPAVLKPVGLAMGRGVIRA